MSEYTWRELERADMDTAAAHAAEMEYRAEQIAHKARKRLGRMEHIVNGLGEVHGEIVRCRDCWHYNAGSCYADQWSTASLMPPHRVTPYGFCAWGERKDGDAR